jgi:glycosyltransferase involved in cell wall biosynthesis
MQAHQYLLSICVPTYNRQFMLERNIAFHLEQFRKSGIAFELVIVDDCSTDETAAYLQSLAAVPEVNAFRRLKNSGFVSNYAFAMQRARGKYAIFLGDDDLLIPEKVLQYIRMMELDPNLGVIQAPWMLVERRGGTDRDMQPFYDIPAGGLRHRKGDMPSLLNMILDLHVFPEFMIIRRDVLSRSVSEPAPFIFWAFLYTARALEQADILFVPEPFARVTAVSDDPRLQQGNKECMFEWDKYRGGLEYLVSKSQRLQPANPANSAELQGRLNHFMRVRQAVALRLHVAAHNWAEAYVLYHRMSVYGPPPLSAEKYDEICKLAGLVSASREAGSYSAQPIVVDPMIDRVTLQLLPADIRSRVTYDISSPFMSSEPRAYLRLDTEFPANPGPRDAVFDIRDYIAQFS